MNSAIVVEAFLLITGFVVWLVAPRLRAESRRRHPSEYITNNMPSGMITVDLGGVITAHNPASERIFGYELSTGRRLSELVVQKPRLDELLGTCMKTDEAFTREEFDVSDAVGNNWHIGINLSSITGPAGQIEGAICLLSDLTKIVKLQEQIRLKDNFAALGEMSAGIAHEFKNSLATISGYS
jgi:PAS domain S-box-containing protein